MTATEAFDDRAERYDDVAESALGRALRARVYRWIGPLLHPGAHIIDLGCGTGLDAAWLAQRVATVHGIDPSSEMIRIAAQRCAGLTNVSFEIGDGAAGNAVVAGRQPADVLLSNFGAINCRPDLTGLNALLAQNLVPGGHAVLVSMAPTCPSEQLVGWLRGNRALRERRTGRRDVDDPDLALTYAAADELADALCDFELVRTESLGLVLPTFEQRARLERRPKLLAALAEIDRLTGPIGGRLGWGDHVIAEFRYTPTAGR